jgi:hypothetical protein
MKKWEIALVVGAWLGLAVVAGSTLAICLMVDRAEWLAMVATP